MSDPQYTSLGSGENKSIHHSPAEWVDFGYRPVESLARVTRTRRKEWRHFFESHRRPGTGPFCAPDIWIPWFFANPHYAPRIFEKHDSAGYLRAVLPLYWNGKTMSAACDTEFPYQELVAKSVGGGVDLMLDVLAICEERQINLTLEKVIDSSLLSEVLKHPSIIEKAEVVGRLTAVENSASFPVTAKGRDDLVSTFPVTSAMDEIHHYSGKEITGGLISELSFQHRGSRCSNRYFERVNFEHFLNLQSANSDRLVLSVRRSGEDIESYLIGYFENDTYHLVTQCHFSRQHSGLLHQTIHHFCSKAKGPVFEVRNAGAVSHGKLHQIRSYKLFPRKNANVAKITGYRFLARAKHLRRQLCGPAPVSSADTAV